MLNIPKTQEAYYLLHNGVLALARAEQQGIRIDMEYLEGKMNHIKRMISRLEEKFKSTTFFKHWQHSKNGKVNIYSGDQLEYFLYKIKKYEPVKYTENSTDEDEKGSTDDEALKQLNIPELDILLELRKLNKVLTTYLGGFAREQVDGYMHPVFNLHLARSYRSCIAQGTNILVMRDFEKKGIPIEEVKVGDYVYCFDDNLNPTIQKVLWSGKTGHKKVIRLHYYAKCHKGFLDVTPEHLIRLIDGSYHEAQTLVGRNIRTLSCSRNEDKLNFTGHLINGSGILEHRFIYEQLVGRLEKTDVIHHKDRNHLNHSISNLEKMTLPEHSKLHGASLSQQEKEKRIEILNQNRHKIIYKKGEENPNYLNLSKFTCLRLLAEAGGRWSKVPMDFNTFKQYLSKHFIDTYKISIRFNQKHEYVWKGVLKRKMTESGRSEVGKELKLGHYDLIRLLQYYNIPILPRKWANQFGEFAPGNHYITKVEYIDKTVDVYDIEVEKYHNFFANEICVHNSSDHPNFQNIPIRDEEAKKMCRSALFPRPGHQLMEWDYSGMEVRANACYNKDAELIRYLKDPTSDMHKDQAKEIFMLSGDEHFSKAGFKTLRQAAKNGFVFAEFYGDYYGNCAANTACNWGQMPKEGKWKKGMGIELGEFLPIHLGDHLIEQGIKSLADFTEHMKEVEKKLWEKFHGYAEWKNKWYNDYLKKGYFDLLSGFRCQGVMDKKEVINYPGQGTGFHCMLKSLIGVDEVMYREGWDTKLVGQIHDSMIFDVHPKELPYISKIIHKIMTTGLMSQWGWICVPMEVEAEITPIDRPWAEKEKFNLELV